MRRHVYLAIGLGFMPLPMVDIIALTAVQVDMVEELSRYYGVPFAPDRTRAIVAGLIAGLGSVAVAATLARSFFKLVPVLGLFVGAVGIPALGGALTQALGNVFVAHYESGGTMLTFDVEQMRGRFRDEFARVRTNTEPVPSRGSSAH